MTSRELIDFIKKDPNTYDYNIVSNNDYTTLQYIPFVNRFNSNQNIKYLTGRMILENHLDRDIVYDIVYNKIQEYSKSWTSLGKFDDLKIIEAPDEITLLSYYNKIFIDAFSSDIKKQFNIYHDTNPFREKINGKTRDMMMPTDYENMDVQQDASLFTTNELFNSQYNKIPFWERALYKRNVDKELDGLTGAGLTGGMTALSYQRFPKKDLEQGKVDIKPYKRNNY